MGIIKTAIKGGVGVYGINQLSKAAANHENNNQRQRNNDQFDNTRGPQMSQGDAQKQYFGAAPGPYRDSNGQGPSRDVYYSRDQGAWDSRNQDGLERDIYSQRGDSAMDGYYQDSSNRRQEEKGPPSYQENGMKLIQDRLQGSSSRGLGQAFEVVSGLGENESKR